MDTVFELRLFNLLDSQLNANPLVYSKNDFEFYQNKPKLWAHITQPNAWAILHCRYFGPTHDSKLEFLQELVEFYNTTKINTQLIVISSFDMPQLKNCKNVHFFYFPEYQAYYYPLYKDFTLTSNVLTKKILSLNKRGSIYRQLLYQFFYHNDFLKDSYFSYLCETGHCGKLFDENYHSQIEHWISDLSIQWPEIQTWRTPREKFITVNDEEKLNHYQHWSDLQGWETGTLDPSWIHDTSLYTSSFCSVVVETCPEDSFVNISEKTIRAICLGHPIIFVAAPNTVKFLESLGLDMYRDVLDQSYDSIVDPIERMKKVVEPIRQINQYSLTELTDLNRQLEPRRRYNIDVIKSLYKNTPTRELEITQSLERMFNQDFSRYYPKPNDF